MFGLKGLVYKQGDAGDLELFYMVAIFSLVFRPGNPFIYYR